MESPTFVIKTKKIKPEIEIEIKEWITGRQAEYIQGPLMGSVNLNGVVNGGKMEVDSEKANSAMQESDRRQIECYVARVGEEKDPKKCVELILDFPEDDYEFVQKKILEAKAGGKKK